MSTNNASAYPLASAMGSTAPSKASLGFVVDSPSLSSAHPSGIESSLSEAAIIRPLATTLVDKSIRMGNPLLVGTPRAIGLVPKKGSYPPQGGMAGSELVRANPMNPFSTALSQ